MNLRKEEVSMKTVFLSVFVLLRVCLTGAPAISHYWLVEEDFIKIGKKDLYEEEKKKDLRETSFDVIGVEDLENPQYVFLMPLKGVASLGLYPPIQNRKIPLLDSCLHFKIFSLHEFLPKSSFRAESTFSDATPYFSYGIYSVSPGTELLFEQHLERLVAKQTKLSLLSWRAWKVLMGGDIPKYVICLSFSSKEELKECNLVEVFEEIHIEKMLRDRKVGWMKKQVALSKVK